MYMLAQIIQYFFPLIALVLLIIGIKGKNVQYVIASLWISLIAVLITFQFSGNQIFGTYFDSLNATIYSFTLVILLSALIRITAHLKIDHPVFSYLSAFTNVFLIIGACLIITNLWINASFIKNKKPDTPIMQVALIDKPNYCQYKYVFYQIIANGTVMYLCPNHYGLIASVGYLDSTPDFITNQLHLSKKVQLR